MVLFHPPPFLDRNSKVLFSVVLPLLKSVLSVHSVHTVCMGLPPDVVAHSNSNFTYRPRQSPMTFWVPLERVSGCKGGFLKQFGPKQVLICLSSASAVQWLASFRQTGNCLPLYQFMRQRMWFLCLRCQQILLNLEATVELQVLCSLSLVNSNSVHVYVKTTLKSVREM